MKAASLRRGNASFLDPRLREDDDVAIYAYWSNCLSRYIGDDKR
jgi:hypothetical protein